jgi:hypothetical protein
MKLDRELATKSGFVWIPTGHIFGKPSGMVGYWHGERNADGKPIVEFADGEELPVNPNAVYIATDEEIENELI